MEDQAQDLGWLRIGESPRETLECDLQAELDAHPVLTEAIAHCESVSDFVSRELLEHILMSEEEHIDWLETQIALMDSLGERNYLQAKLS